MEVETGIPLLVWSRFFLLELASHQTIGGLLYYTGDSDEASLNPALNAAVLLNRYVPLASTQTKKQDYYVDMYCPSAFP